MQIFNVTYFKEDIDHGRTFKKNWDVIGHKPSDVEYTSPNASKYNNILIAKTTKFGGGGGKQREEKPWYHSQFKPVDNITLKTPYPNSKK